MDFFTFWPNDISDQNYQKDRFIGILFRISYSNMLSSRNLKIMCQLFTRRCVGLTPVKRFQSNFSKIIIKLMPVKLFDWNTVYVRFFRILNIDYVIYICWILKKVIIFWKDEKYYLANIKKSLSVALHKFDRLGIGILLPRP